MNQETKNKKRIEINTRIITGLLQQIHSKSGCLLEDVDEIMIQDISCLINWSVDLLAKQSEVNIFKKINK